MTGSHEAGGLSFRSQAPGHADDHLAFLAGDTLFSGDVLFQDAVGSGNPDQVRDSVMRLMEPPPDRVYRPHHETTIGREWEENPFVLVWRGTEPEGTERCGSTAEERGRSSRGRLTTTAKGKGWVRFDGGTGRIMGGSRIERI